MPKSKRLICDYFANTCTCTGYKASQSTLCVCGHALIQHNKVSKAQLRAVELIESIKAVDLTCQIQFINKQEKTKK
jgi:hypothetical protein